jgi:hypothetical protein
VCGELEAVGEESLQHALEEGVALLARKFVERFADGLISFGFHIVHFRIEPVRTAHDLEFLEVVDRKNEANELTQSVGCCG